MPYAVQAHSTVLTPWLPSIPPMLHGLRVRSRLRPSHAQNMLTRRGTSHYQLRQAHSERLCSTCCHAVTKLASASRGHGRPTCTQEAYPQPISARARPLRHDNCELAADVAVARDARDGRPALAPNG